MNRRIYVVVAGLALAGITAMAPLYAGAPQGAAVVTLKGAEKDVSQAVKLTPGVYLVKTTGGGGMVSVELKQAGNSAYVGMFNDKNTVDLIGTDGTTVKPGDATFVVSGVAAWTLTATRVDGAGAGPLPQVLAAGELGEVIGNPFKAAAGNMTVTYTYKGTPKGTGTMIIYDLGTGKILPTKMMTAGRATGTFTVPVTAAGTFVAMARFPLASGGGEIKISQ